ncbi:GNAT family N-acetyltransferase [Shewanella psychrotolerans]|nr:GNAT family N-acetyltransferase [Shewanella psychrotolerans]
MTCFSVRPIQKGELNSVYFLEKSLFGDHGYPDFFFRQSFDCWPRGLQVAVDKHNNLLGYILVAPSEQAQCVWILSVVVDTLAQGRGVGRRLIVDAITSLPKHVTEVKLTVAPTNPARHLYRSLGFIEHCVEEDYFGPGECRVLMLLNLEP